MNRAIYVLILILAVSSACLFFSGDSGASLGKVNVYGRVYDTSTRKVLSRAEVTISYPGFSASGVSDGGGNYSISVAVSERALKVTCAKSGYQTYTGTIPGLSNYDYLEYRHDIFLGKKAVPQPPPTSPTSSTETTDTDECIIDDTKDWGTGDTDLIPRRGDDITDGGGTGEPIDDGYIPGVDITKFEERPKKKEMPPREIGPGGGPQADLTVSIVTEPSPPVVVLNEDLSISFNVENAGEAIPRMDAFFAHSGKLILAIEYRYSPATTLPGVDLQWSDPVELERHEVPNDTVSMAACFGRGGTGYTYEMWYSYLMEFMTRPGTYEIKAVIDRDHLYYDINRENNKKRINIVVYPEEARRRYQVELSVVHITASGDRGDIHLSTDERRPTKVKLLQNTGHIFKALIQNDGPDEATGTKVRFGNTHGFMEQIEMDPISNGTARVASTTEPLRFAPGIYRIQALAVAGYDNYNFDRDGQNNLLNSWVEFVWDWDSGGGAGPAGGDKIDLVMTELFVNGPNLPKMPVTRGADVDIDPGIYDFEGKIINTGGISQVGTGKLRHADMAGGHNHGLINIPAPHDQAQEEIAFTIAGLRFPNAGRQPIAIYVEPVQPDEDQHVDDNGIDCVMVVSSGPRPANASTVGVRMTRFFIGTQLVDPANPVTVEANSPYSLSGAIVNDGPDDATALGALWIWSDAGISRSENINIPAVGVRGQAQQENPFDNIIVSFDTPGQYQLLAIAGPNPPDGEGDNNDNGIRGQIVVLDPAPAPGPVPPGPAPRPDPGPEPLPGGREQAPASSIPDRQLPGGQVAIAEPWFQKLANTVDTLLAEKEEAAEEEAIEEPAVEGYERVAGEQIPVWPASMLFLLYTYISSSLHIIAKRTATPLGWLAWIPIANIYLMCKIAGKPGWWFWLFFIPLVNLVLMVVVWMGIAVARKKPDWLGILMLVPLINLILPGYLAFSR